MRLGRNVKLALVAVTVTVLLLSPLSMACPPPPPEPNKEGDIWAGQTTIVGNYEIWIDGNNVKIMFWIDSGWCLDDNHIVVTTNMDDYTNKKGNPKIGKFPFKATWSSTDGAYVITVDRTADPVNWESGDDLWIAIHVVVSDCCGGSSETGWGEGEEEWGSSWGWYFDP
jgi:hypothetical protein